MLASSTAEAYLQMSEVPLNITEDMCINNRIDVVQEFQYLTVLFEKSLNLSVKSCKLPIILIPTWIVDSTTVKDIASSVA